jgi:hypothetical protein
MTEWTFFTPEMGATLREIRLKRGLTLDEVAARMGLAHIKYQTDEKTKDARVAAKRGFVAQNTGGGAEIRERSEVSREARPSHFGETVVATGIPHQGTEVIPEHETSLPAGWWTA